MVATATVPEVQKMATTPVVEIQDLCKVYHLMMGKELHALTNLTLTIPKGETFAIVGPNGSGKTTTMKILLNLIFPTSGEVSLFGRAPGDSEAQARIGYLPEAPYFYEYLNGRELLEYYGKLCNIPSHVLQSADRSSCSKWSISTSAAPICPSVFFPAGCASASASRRR